MYSFGRGVVASDVFCSSVSVSKLHPERYGAINSINRLISFRSPKFIPLVFFESVVFSMVRSSSVLLNTPESNKRVTRQRKPPRRDISSWDFWETGTYRYISFVLKSKLNSNVFFNKNMMWIVKRKYSKCRWKRAQKFLDVIIRTELYMIANGARKHYCSIMKARQRKTKKKNTSTFQ